MMVFHHTGDRYWLSERFRPERDIRLIAPEDAGLLVEFYGRVSDESKYYRFFSPVPRATATALEMNRLGAVFADGSA